MPEKTVDLKVRFLSLRNSIDFYLRNQLRFSRPIRPDAPTPGIDYRVQSEFKEFLELFDWKAILKKFPNDKTLVAADVGARNFCFAPVLDEFFMALGRKLELHGLEVDAFRRLHNFHTRFDYGVFYASQCRRAEFHAVDFLKWSRPLDIAFLLNPFVTKEPTVHWGLPLSKLKPQGFFEHAYSLLKERNGIAMVSSPNIEEFELALEFATKAGFQLGNEEEVAWRPHENSQQKKPRYGIVLYSKLS